MRLVKLNDTYLIDAPRSRYIYNNTVYAPYVPDEVLIADGWKEYVEDDMPQVPEGSYPEIYYSETDTQVIGHWRIVEDSPEMIVSKLRNWFDYSYRMYNEKLTRFAALGITETVEDEYRSKTYHNLMELYEEAEIVRAEINELENDAEVSD